MSQDIQQTVKQKLTLEEKARNKKEYNREWYLRNKEKKDEQSKKYYKEKHDDIIQHNTKISERYRMCYKVLKEILSKPDLLPEEYRIKATNALNIGKND
jgi:hypothetical protein